MATVELLNVHCAMLKSKTTIEVEIEINEIDIEIEVEEIIGFLYDTAICHLHALDAITVGF